MSNVCLDMTYYDPKILEFLVFDCLLSEEFKHSKVEEIITMILNLIKAHHNKISIFFIEFITECIVILSLKRFDILKYLKDSALIDEEKNRIRSIFQFFEFYIMQFATKKFCIIQKIALLYCFYVNYEREYSWKVMTTFLSIENKKLFKCFLDFLQDDFHHQKYKSFENYLFYDVYDETDDKVENYKVLYSNFIHQNEDENNNLILKYRKKITKGALYFIGVIVM